MKGYIITGCYYTEKAVYLNKETAEKVCEDTNECIAMGGSHEFVRVVEVEIVTD